ncbi:DUF58 domain-containing protein [Clostridium sp.]|uniref:DUF58 domain-containing protein n=1 Tax=Clostridium sp. TaxID=1506 RepID=UPI00321761C3
MIKINKSYGLLIIGSLIFAIFSGGNLPYSIFYCVSIVFIISGVYTHFTRRSLYIEIESEKGILMAGDDNKVTIRVYNDTVFPIPYIEIQNSLLKKVSNRYRGDMVSININSNKFLKKQINILTRGEYKLGESSCLVSDIFGIFTWKSIYKHEGVIKVYPRVYPLSNVRINGANLKEYNIKTVKELHRGPESLETIKNIREYRVGDSYRRVNWKVTAKHGKLFIKEYESSESPRIHVFLDLRKEPFNFDKTGENEEALVEFFLSLVMYIEERNTNLQAVVIGENTKSFNINNKSQFEMLRECMVTRYSNGKGSLSMYMKNSIYEINKRSAVVVVSYEIQKETMEYLMSLANEGYEITLFYLDRIPGINEQNILEVEGRGISCYNIEGFR